LIIHSNILKIFFTFFNIAAIKINQLFIFKNMSIIHTHTHTRNMDEKNYAELIFKFKLFFENYI